MRTAKRPLARFKFALLYPFFNTSSSLSFDLVIFCLFPAAKKVAAVKGVLVEMGPTELLVPGFVDGTRSGNTLPRLSMNACYHDTTCTCLPHQQCTSLSSSPLRRERP